MTIGKKIKDLRIKQDMTQEELAMCCGLSGEFISQLERDLTSPSITTLVSILECLDSNLKDFFNEKTQERIVFKPGDFHVSVCKELHMEKAWMVPNYRKNLLEPVLINLDVAGRTEKEDPHRGEEFGYVLAGMVDVYLGEKKYRAQKGESFSYRPVMPHYLSNGGREKAIIILVSTRRF